MSLNNTKEFAVVVSNSPTTHAAEKQPLAIS